MRPHKPMTKQQAMDEFRFFGGIESTKGDPIARREAWNNFTDSLRSDGLITLKQYETWVNPY